MARKKARSFRDVLPKRTDGKQNPPFPRDSRPLKNVVSRETVFAQMRAEIRKHPRLWAGLLPRHRKLLGLDKK